MSVWVCVPSKRPAEHVKRWAEAWRDMGYEIALWRDAGDESAVWKTMVLIEDSRYPGYAVATNTLIKEAVLEGARWFVIGGDDVWPDPSKRADEIARECEEYFIKLPFGIVDENTPEHLRPNVQRLVACASQLPQATFGCMQPTGDRWQDTPQMRARFGEDRGALIDRVAGSAWIGREFALRAYGGNGPLWPEYTHMYADEELQCVAEKLGVFWQRRDLTQRHEHWAREKPGETMGHQANMPEFLKEANSPQHWDKYGAIFKARKAAGFPGHEVKV